MTIYEILVIIAVVLFFVFLAANYAYRKKKRLPTGECQYCHTNKRKKLLKMYYRKYKRTNK